jgi:hypothetical protein
MSKKSLFMITALILPVLILSACNLPERQVSQVQTPNSTAVVIPKPSPTPVSMCDNQYFPSTLGNTWEYSGSNTALGDYSRTDTVTSSNAEAFSVGTTSSGVTYGVDYGCSKAGLTASNPVQQYAGALVSGPNAPVSIKLSSLTGITLPAKLAPGNTWQQTADFEATSPQLNMNGKIVIDYTAVGYENVTVPYGTFNTMRVDAIIRILVTPLKIEAGTYNVSTWLAPEVGIIKSEGTSHVSGIDFSDSMQLTRFTPAP